MHKNTTLAKKAVFSIIKNPLFSGSAVMIVGSNLVNLTAYIYHLIVGRMLGPSLYSELASILSLMGLVFTSFGFVGLVIVKFVSAAEVKDLPAIFNWFSKKLYTFGLLVSLFLLLITPFLSRFLKIDFKVVILLSPILMVSVVSFLYQTFLQGTLKFKELVVGNNLNILGRLVIGVLLIRLGYGVFGAVFAMLLSAFIGMLIMKYFIKDIRLDLNKGEFKQGKNVLSYALPIFVASLASTSFFSSDVILVKHYFDTHQAGIYASLSTLGKIIYYGTAPIASVMFPMISKKHSRGENFKKIFLLSVLLTTMISSFIVLTYWLFPELSIKVLYGPEYLEGKIYLVWFGLFMMVYSLVSLVANYFLSHNKTTVAYFLVTFSLLQIVGISFFHENILKVIIVSIIAVSLLLVSLFIYLVYETKKRK